MKTLTVLTLSLALLFSISLCMEQKDSSDDESGERGFEVGDLDKELDVNEEDTGTALFDKYLRGIPGDTSIIKERALAKLEQMENVKGGNVTRSKHKEDLVLAALFGAQQEALELKQQEVNVQKATLKDARESSKTATRFAWLGFGLGLTSFAAATVISLTNLIISVESNPTVECVCN